MTLRPHRRRLALAAVALALAGAAPSLVAVTPADLSALLARGDSLLLIDVRSSVAYQEAHIPGAINIPLSLLPQKTLPAGARVIVYGDGLGLIGDAEALAIARELRVASVDVLEGGYAAWQSTAAPTTAAGGATRERLPGITYQQLVAAPKDGVVLVDLRVPAAAKVSGAATAQAMPAPDLVDTFAKQLGVPVRRSSAGGARTMSASSAATTPTDAARTAAAIATDIAAAEKTSASTPPLLVLVADSEAAANEAARQLRASGYHRFTILIGGTLTIEHEGRQGSARGETEPQVVHGQN
jgi:rhodanese-related sulfurtransferase